jgi:RimJ/RimL family protein N-acetyltransferase
MAMNAPSYSVTKEPASGPAYRIVTERLVIRCWEPRDAPMLSAAIEASKEHLRPWMPWAKDLNDVDSVYQRLRKFRADFDLGTNFVYGVLDRGETMVLGGTGFHPRVGPGALEIGYWVHVDHVGRGYATELAAALTKVAFEVNGVHRVDIHVDPANARSVAVPRKLGFTREATLRSRLVRHDGTYADSTIWTMLREEYEASSVKAARVEAFDGMGRRMV